MEKKINFLFIIIALFYSVSAHAFIFIRGGAYAKGERPVSNALMWSGRTLYLKVNTDQTVYAGSIVPELTTGEFQSALTTAVAQWNNVCGSDVQVVITGTSTNTKNSGDSTNTVSWDNRTTGEGNVIADTSTLAVAYSSVNNGTSTTVDCDIVVNGEAAGNFGIDGGATTYDLVGILVHEIGHCLGLDHSIEPPTFTSTNPILLTASMSSTVAAGDLSARTISQDEIDGMECVNPSGGTARAGTFCTSYHGSNGGGALSGTVSGGPSSTRTCGDGTSAAVKASLTSGGGCVSKAIASPSSKKDVAEPFYIDWFFICIFISLLYFLIQRVKKYKISKKIFLLLLIPTFNLKAADLEFAYQYTSAKPALMNSSAALTSAEGTFTSTTSSPDSTFKAFDDLYAAFSYMYSSNTSLGIYYKQNLREQISLKGYSGSTLLITKNTELDGWLAGIVAKFFLLDSKETNLFLEIQLGAGTSEYKQNITDSSGALSSLEASAVAIESNFFLGFQMPVFASINMTFKAGYSRFQSNYYSADSVSGTRYSSIQTGRRITLQNNDEVRLVRSGVAGQVGLVLGF